MKEENNIFKLGMGFFSLFCMVVCLMGWAASSQIMITEAVWSFIVLEIMLLINLQRDRYYAKKRENIYNRVCFLIKTEGMFVLAAGMSWMFILCAQLFLDWKIKWYVIIYFVSILLGVLFEAIHPSDMKFKKKFSDGKKGASIGFLFGVTAIYVAKAVIKSKKISQKMMKLIYTGGCMFGGILFGFFAGIFLYRLVALIDMRRKNKI